MRVRRSALSVALVLSLLCALLTSGVAAARGSSASGLVPTIVRVTTFMVGEAEVPGPGDPDGSGLAVITLDARNGRVCYQLQVEGIAPATAAHIHFGSPNVAGPVVVPLGAPTNGLSKGCVNVNRMVVRGIAYNPMGYYVNVHNAVYPAGAIRGQLVQTN